MVRGGLHELRAREPTRGSLLALALCDLADVLAAAGRTDEAVAALEQALDRYRRKMNLAMVAQVEPRLEALRRGEGVATP